MDQLPIRLEGEAALAEVGAAVLSPGDLDGDGADDLVVTAPGDFYGAPEAAGEVLVFRGPLAGRLERSDAAVRLANDRAGSHLGISLATGDLDGDGRTDLVAGAPFDSFWAPIAGLVYGWTSADLFGHP